MWKDSQLNLFTYNAEQQILFVDNIVKILGLNVLYFLEPEYIEFSATINSFQGKSKQLWMLQKAEAVLQ